MFRSFPGVEWKCAGRRLSNAIPRPCLRIGAMPCAPADRDALRERWARETAARDLEVQRRGADAAEAEARMRFWHC